MVSYRLLPVLFILTIGFIQVTGENPEEVPCEEETTTRTTVPSITPTTVTTTTTTVPKTNTIHPCANVDAPVAPYRTDTGAQCRAVSDCNLNGLVLSSMETDEEKASYIDCKPLISIFDLIYLVIFSGQKNNSQYYWDDGQAVPTIDQQPTIVDPAGSFAWFINKNSSIPGYGDHRVVALSGRGTPQVNGVICGAPGLQFTN
ncbi:hypothetical protein GCK72_007945 [Caenorhabditis remanei]|uniref:C-type lectin domain-containing protein n=1 Tax=Caenorhabditis remanei TaxID=31234 RepID=A0A6A5HN07_CAERE|nr:hypothetical protein GCK72_007945 [Caenorhabditis remanei]KAF1767984.1 hypothetical protein GCK72_007945 [Caenorhabditis remanei]